MEDLAKKTPSPLQKKRRDSNLELFRIITMLLIVAHHYVVNSGLTDAGGVIYSSPTSWRSIFLLLIGAWGKTGINCFMMITGYFMCKSNITLQKYLKLLGEIVFYRITISLIFLLTGYESFTIASFIKTALPITSIETGFTSSFLIFYLFIPFLNILLRGMNQRQHLCLLALCGFTYILFGTLHRVKMNYVSWFIVIYLISAYLRLYPAPIFTKTKLWGLLTIGFMTVAVASVICCVILGMKRNQSMAYYFVTDSNTFLAVATGVCAFLFFKNLRLPYNKFINTVAASTFGVLCIHAHSATMRQWLWCDLLDNVGHYSSALMPLHIIGSTLAIFVACTLIDIARIRWIETPFFRLFDRQWTKAEPVIKEKLDDLFSIVTIPTEQ